MNTFADALVAARRGAHLTQQQVADYLGIDRWVYSLFERGKTTPAPRHIETICALYGISAQTLTSGVSPYDL